MKPQSHGARSRTTQASRGTCSEALRVLRLGAATGHLRGQTLRPHIETILALTHSQAQLVTELLAELALGRALRHNFYN